MTLHLLLPLVGVKDILKSNLQKIQIKKTDINSLNKFVDFVNHCDKLKFEINSITNSITDQFTTMKCYSTIKYSPCRYFK